MDEARFRAAERRMWESVGVAAIDRSVPLRRTGLSVRLQEVGEGDPVLFVHGTTNSGASWAPLVARLPGFRSIVLDRPGCGLSDPVGAPFSDVASLASFAEAVLVDVLDALDLPDAHVVATSFGGYFALRTAAAHPERVRRLVELGWTVGAPMAHVPAIMRVATAPALGRVFAALPASERMVRSMLRRIGLRQALDAGRVSQEAVDCYVALLRHTDTMRNEVRAGPRLITLRGSNTDILLPAELLGRIRTPAYFLWGEEDPFGGAEIARAFVSNLPGAELELVPGAGHAVWMDDPDGVAARTARFLRG